MHWFKQPIKGLNSAMAAEAEQRQAQLTKPSGSLGRLESLVVQLAAMQGQVCPRMDTLAISVFAADHGLAESGVSAFPQAVTAQMVQNFLNGGAAIAVLAQQHQAHFEVVDVGVKAEFRQQPGLVQAKVGYGTASCLTRQAMSETDALAALEVGKLAAERAFAKGAQCFIGGEMGIGNTASASLILAALLQAELAPLVGAGTGLDQDGVARKRQILQQVFDFHQAELQVDNGLDVLMRFGGFEIAALSGAYIRCAQLGLPVLVDGVITTAAACVAETLAPGAKAWWLYSHLSVEPAHSQALAFLAGQPILQLDLRLGEASGAALAWPLLQQACVLHQRMATFEEAQVAAQSVG